MAYLLSGERPSTAAPSFSPFRAFLAWAAKVRANRVQRTALVTLLEYDAHRLDDLGINRAELFDALRAPRPGVKLSLRRAERSRLWLDP